ncbi:Fantastic four [Thalictrum thalictroides]|uniref:Fantastic four n=1 Tax=Thalictrum thalictroides TaxID=46969 RepID=A0A7J6VXM3_THATH|nr:Fantastic four [Thalictrum thalictroides]
MSTTTVCRVGLQSCLEPKIVEPLTLHLTLVSPKPNSPQSIIDAPPLSDLESDNEEREVHEYMENINNKKDITSSSNGGWSFIESLTKDANEDKETTPYVHPLDKRSMSTLTNKSLELCTESLGSETGSDISDENDLYSSSSSSDDSESRKFQLPIRERSRFSRLLHKKAAIRPSFPPPLTSISGSDYVQFTPHREGGRLVIKAVTIATAPTCFEAERSNGRLRLHFKTMYITVVWRSIWEGID